MKITFLGTGTSHGVPMIGCDCPVCRSEDQKNKRGRCSVLIETQAANILIDTPPELRLQVVRENVRAVDGILFTHAHADHIFGLDDVRRFNDLSGKTMPCYGSTETLRIIRQAFEYVFVPTQIGGGKPSLELIPVDGRFKAAGVDVVPVPVLHGRMRVLGFRIGSFAYVTDCSAIPPSSMELLRSLDVLVVGAIRHEPHETHFSISEGLAVIQELRPTQAFMTHITHRLDHQKTNESLPPGVELAYDGLNVEIHD